ncbi:unnamed protein product [Bemisia tabaci]|uniref:Uncharacterized protein n=1 Tax=Bemisia tabaci TaxID=7038 RepID=A0A9P0EX77_BEMTA|nr:unnamed protein product [Bemisia tabaci]
MSMIANKWAKSNNDEAEETLHTDHSDPELDSQESVEQSSRMGPPVEYSSSHLPKEHRIFDPEPGSHSREAFNFVKQGTRFRANEVEHPFLSLLRQYSQGASKSSHFDVIAHELHSKISELCASFHAAWLHTLTATTESAKPSAATTEKSVLTSVGKPRPSQLTDRRPKRSYADERTVKSSDDQITYESHTQPEVSPSYRKPQIKIKSNNDRRKRAFSEYLPLSARGKESTKSKTSVSISPTRKHIMRLERKSGPALDASSPSKPQNLIKSIENFKKLAKLDLEQLENIDLEDGFAIDELDADALVSPSPSDPTEDLVEIHALPSITEATPSTRGNAKSTNVNSSNVKRPNAKSTIAKSTDVKITDVKSTDVKTTNVKSTDVKSTNVKSIDSKSNDVISTNVEIPNVTLRTYSQSSKDSYSRINRTTENLAEESGICQPCQSTPLPSEVKMGVSDEDLALTSTSLNEGLEQGLEESYPTFPTPPHSFDNLSSSTLQNELESAVKGVKPTDSTVSSNGREASLEFYPPRLTVTDEVESDKVDSYDSRTGIHSNGTDDTELVEEIDVFKTVNTQRLSEFPDDETLPTFPVQSSREPTESPDDEPLTTFPGKINEGPPDYQEATGSPHFKTPSPVLISPVNSVRKPEAERLVSPAFRLISSGSPVEPLYTNVITEPPEILSNAKSSDIAEDDISWKSIGVREPDISEDGDLGSFPNTSPLIL